MMFFDAERLVMQTQWYLNLSRLVTSSYIVILAIILFFSFGEKVSANEGETIFQTNAQCVTLLVAAA